MGAPAETWHGQVAVRSLPSLEDKSCWPGPPTCARHGVEITSAELFCRILSICPHHQLDHSCGRAWLEKWAFLVLQIHSLNTQLTPSRLGFQKSRALASKRSKRARQSPNQDTPQKHESLAQACSPRTATLSQHLILKFSRKTALPQHGAGLLWGVFH